MSRLFSLLESRGEDAAGFWGLAGERDLFHKQPGRSSDLVESEVWEETIRSNPSLLICHARGASRGNPSENKNNHPFVSGSMAVVHNGRVLEETYERLLLDHPVESDCDSEIILRIIEKTPGGTMRAIRRVWEALEGSHMAVAVGERSSEGCRMWLFRNEHRTLWTVDLRETLGQIFFASTDEIWHEASEGLVEALPKELSVGSLSLFEFSDSVAETTLPL